MSRLSPIVFALAGLLLCACASHPALDSKTAADMVDGPIPAGKARIYVFAGSWYSGGLTLGYPQGFVVRIDGVSVGRLGPGEAIAVDVPRGHHAVARNLITVFGDSPDAVSADLGGVADGERIYLGVDRVGSTSEVHPLPGSGALVGAVAGTLNYAASHSDAPHDPGEYLDFRDDGPEMLRDRTFVTPDPTAVAQLSKR
jgi:hypothetical protein